MISVHDLRGMRRAARKRYCRALVALTRDRSSFFVALPRLCDAVTKRDAEFRRADRALCERLSLPWYP
jgi:hypothetical protein